MTALIILYILLFIVVAVYAGVNVYHLFRFRLKEPNDKTLVAVFVYLVIVVGVVGVTLFTGVVAFNL